MNNGKQVLIFGATGNVGGATTRELLKRGWSVRAVTRNPTSDKAKAVANLGAEVVQGDMADKASLEAAFDGIQRVLSVQNPWISGSEGELHQGKLVAEVARSAKVEHLVYSSAGTGLPNTGIPHFQTKVEVETHIRNLEIPFTVIRPGPFMEVLVKKEFYPAMGAWGAEPKVLGWNTPIPWVAVSDIGIAAANIFDDPKKWLGKDVTLFGDVKTLAECKDVFREVNGKKPFRLPLPLWLFRKMAGNELILMWKWMVEWIADLGPEGLGDIVESSRKVCPEMLDLESWLKLMRTKNS
jgi:uncharacterized protein YbjT (DUF2867 family)